MQELGAVDLLEDLCTSVPNDVYWKIEDLLTQYYSAEAEDMVTQDMRPENSSNSQLAF